MKFKLAMFGFCFSLLFVSGCATTSGWKRMEVANQQQETVYFSVVPPRNWMILEQEGQMMISRDGVPLQHMMVARRELDKAFPSTKKGASAGMLPSELAENVIAGFKSRGIPSLKILENRPAKLSGKTGFLLHLLYTTDSGLRRELLMTGVVSREGFFLLQYSAPSIHYFERDREKFDALVESFRIIGQTDS